MPIDIEVAREFLRRVTAREPIDAVPEADAFPRLSDDEFNELAKDILPPGSITGRIRVPIVIDASGRLVDGRHRIDFLQTLSGLKPPRWVNNSWHIEAKDKRVIVLDVTVVPASEAVRHTVSLNIMRRHLKPGERADLVARFLQPMTRKDASALGVAARRAKSTKGQMNLGSITHTDLQRMTVVAGSAIANVSESTMKRALRKTLRRESVVKRLPKPTDPLRRPRRLKNVTLQDEEPDRELRGYLTKFYGPDVAYLFVRSRGPGKPAYLQANPHQPLLLTQRMVRSMQGYVDLVSRRH